MNVLGDIGPHKKNIVYPHFAYPYKSYKLKDDEVFIHYCETAPMARGLGIYPFVLSKIINDFFNKKKIISVDAKNTPSIRGIKKVGFKERESKGFYKFRKKENKGYKVMIITQGLSSIVKPIVGNYNVVGIIESAPRNYRNLSRLKKFANELITILKSNNLKRFCYKRNIPYYFMTENDKKLEEWIKAKNPDVIIVYSMSQLLKENIFTIPKYGAINLHPALLPKYRGPNPWFWHYYNGEREFGVTLHFIDKGEDSGDIIYQEKINVPLGIKLETLKKILIDGIGIKLILQALENLENLPRVKQPKKSPTIRAKNITISEYKELIHASGWDVVIMYHFLRGTEDLFNKAFANKFTSKFFYYEIVDFVEENILGYEMGNIYRSHDGMFLACRNGKIYIHRRFSIKHLIRSLIYG